MDTNGVVGRVERVGKVIDRYGIPTMLIAVLLWFWFGDWRFHDRKVDTVVSWTQRDLNFTYLDCLRKSKDERQERSCDRAYRGETVERIESRPKE